MEITISLNTPLKQPHFQIPQVSFRLDSLFSIFMGKRARSVEVIMDIIHFDGFATLRIYRNCGSAIPSNWSATWLDLNA